MSTGKPDPQNWSQDLIEHYPERMFWKDLSWSCNDSLKSKDSQTIVLKINIPYSLPNLYTFLPLYTSLTNVDLPQM